ncbi:MAG: hypothetical protein ACO1NY_00105 [Pseudorhodoplanes sp.]
MKALVNLLTLAMTIATVFVALGALAFLVTLFQLDSSPANDPGSDVGASMAFTGMLLLSLPIAVFGGMAIWVRLFARDAWQKSQARGEVRA